MCIYVYAETIVDQGFPKHFQRFYVCVARSIVGGTRFTRPTLINADADDKPVRRNLDVGRNVDGIENRDGNS